MPETRAKMQEEKDVTNVKRRNVIIDCDPGIDDSLAIMLALSLESISVKGNQCSWRPAGIDVTASYLFR